MNSDGLLALIRQSDLRAAIVIGVALAVAPLVLALWPRAIALTARWRGARPVPSGVSPLVAGELAGLRAADLLTVGFLWILARTPSPHVDAGHLAPDTSAVGLLSESLSPAGSLDDVRAVAEQTLASDNPVHFEIPAVMAGLETWARDDAAGMGLLRERATVRTAILAVAAVELVLAYFIDGSSKLNPTLLVAGAITGWAGLNVDARTITGASLTAQLHALRGRLRDAARGGATIDSKEVLGVLPVAPNGAGAEVWAVAVGCRTARSEQVAARVRIMTHAAAGRPRIIRYTEAVMSTSGQLTNAVSTRVAAAWHIIRPTRRGPGGAAPVIW